jgi:hypothetical protein
MAGNTLGPRNYYLYTSDSGATYSILTDADLASAGGLVLDDTNPPAPRRFKPRGVYAEGTVDGVLRRKFIIIGDAANAAYAADASSDLTIDTATFSTTGRRGEQLSFANNP